MCTCTQYSPVHIHGFSCESFRIAQICIKRIHGFHDTITFLRAIMSCYVLFTDYYEILRYLHTICYELSRTTTSNLRAFYELFTDCYKLLIRKVTIHRSLYLIVTTRLRVITIKLKVFTSPCDFLAQYKKNPANCVSSFDDRHRNSMACERNRFQTCNDINKFASSTSWQERRRCSADIYRPMRKRRPARRMVWCRTWLAKGPSLDSMIIPCMSAEPRRPCSL